MKKLSFIIVLSILLLSSCTYPDYTELRKPPKVTSKMFLQHMTSPGYGFKHLTVTRTDEQEKQFMEEFGKWRNKQEEVSFYKKYQQLTAEGRIREEITLKLFKNLRKDYLNKNMTCETKQENLEKYTTEYFNTAKERNWIDYEVIPPSSTIEKTFNGIFNSISYPCSTVQRELLRREIALGRVGNCNDMTHPESPLILCKETRDHLAKYDKEFLSKIDKNGLSSILTVNQ